MDLVDILTKDPHQHPHAFARAFNSGDPDLLDLLYEDAESILVDPSGEPTAGAARHAANAGLVGWGVPITVHPRAVFVTGDLALLIVDWRLEGTRDGAAVQLTGTATDVARRGADGFWRYVIDNPWGTAPAPRSGVDG